MTRYEIASYIEDKHHTFWLKEKSLGNKESLFAMLYLNGFQLILCYGLPHPVSVSQCRARFEANTELFTYL